MTSRERNPPTTRDPLAQAHTHVGPTGHTTRPDPPVITPALELPRDPHWLGEMLHPDDIATEGRW